MNKQKQRNSRSFISVGQVARHCEVALPTVRRWIEAKQLAAFRTPGGHYRIKIEDFQRFLHKHRMPSYPPEPGETRVLIIDDEPRVVDILADLLKRDPRGLKVETAGDGYEGLMKIGAFRPSLVILDVMMPHLNGIEVARRLRANPETRDIRILGITGYPDKVEPILKAGADACLVKPLDLRRVRRELARFLPR